jgi:hypothetical protein
MGPVLQEPSHRFQGGTGSKKKERKGLSFREAEMWDPWASSVLLVSKAAGDKKRQIDSN